MSHDESGPRPRDPGAKRSTTKKPGIFVGRNEEGGGFGFGDCFKLIIVDALKIGKMNIISNKLIVSQDVFFCGCF